MFLDNLSASIRSLCNARKLGYEADSEQCDLSSRYFGSIARGKTAPSVLTLEKLCVGFDLTPNELLLAPELQHEMMLCEMEPASRVFCRNCPYAHAGIAPHMQARVQVRQESSEPV